VSEDLPDEGPEQEPRPESTEPAAPGTEQDRSGKRTTMMIVAAAVVVLVAIGVGIYLVATSGEDDVAADPPPPKITGVSPTPPPSSAPLPSRPASSPPAATKPPAKPADKNVAAARSAAEQAATAINERDIDAMKQLSCDPSTVGSAEAFPPEATARLAENPQITGDKATAQIELSISGSEPTVVPLPMEKRNGKWCVP
jgi:type IV secretory pathway VirB10-like protein